MDILGTVQGPLLEKEHQLFNHIFNEEEGADQILEDTKFLQDVAKQLITATAKLSRPVSVQMDTTEHDIGSINNHKTEPTCGTYCTNNSQSDDAPE